MKQAEKDLKILVTKRLHGESLFNDFERLRCVDIFFPRVIVGGIVITMRLKRLRWLVPFVRWVRTRQLKMPEHSQVVLGGLGFRKSTDSLLVCLFMEYLYERVLTGSPHFFLTSKSGTVLKSSAGYYRSPRASITHATDAVGSRRRAR